MKQVYKSEIHPHSKIKGYWGKSGGYIIYNPITAYPFSRVVRGLDRNPRVFKTFEGANHHKKQGLYNLGKSISCDIDRHGFYFLDKYQVAMLSIDTFCTLGIILFFISRHP